MNTRSRSATKAKNNPTKSTSSEKGKPEEVVIDSEDDEVSKEGCTDDDDEPEYIPKSVANDKKTPKKKPVKKETKPKAAAISKATPKTPALKHEPKEEPELFDDAKEGDADVYYELNEKEMKEVNHAFDMNKSDDADELLNADSLRTAMRSLGFEPRGHEIQELLKKFSSKKGKLNRDGFHKIMSHKYSYSPGMINESNDRDEISRVFNLLDLDKTGFITIHDLRSIAKELNEELEEAEMAEMIAEADTDGDGKIDKEDFHKIMVKTNLY